MELIPSGQPNPVRADAGRYGDAVIQAEVRRLAGAWPAGPTDGPATEPRREEANAKRD